MTCSLENMSTMVIEPLDHVQIATVVIVPAFQYITWVPMVGGACLSIEGGLLKIAYALH